VAQPRSTFFRLFLPSFLLPSITLLICVGALPQAAAAQEERTFAVGGYITAVHLPAGFDVNGKHVALGPETGYGLIDSKKTSSDNPLKDAVQVGAYVLVKGPTDRHSKTTTAVTVYFRDDWNKKLSGLGVIDKVISTGQEPVFRADGYKIRITPATEVTFAGDLKSMADVGANSWLRYEGKRDKAGVLVASAAQFIPAKPAKFKAAQGLEVSSLQVKRADPKLNPDGSSASLESGGALSPNDKFRFGSLTHWHTVLDDAELQQRVHRVGMRVVPEYQKQLADDHPSKIRFRFYATDDAKTRSEQCSLEGMILVPKQVVARLKNDDQLAAVLADGVAFNLQRQGARIVADNRVLLGTAIAGDVAMFLIPGAGLVSWVGNSTAANKINTAMEEQRGRVALALLSDASYDLRQAPEAWRLLGPKKLPGDLESLNYPSRSGYQLGIINLQYGDKGAAASAAPASVAATDEK
jgi:hypothetical protein